jgi:hypothetical protein
MRAQPWLTPQLPVMHWVTAAAHFCLPLANINLARRESVVDVWDATVLIIGRHTSGLLASHFGPACRLVCTMLGFDLLEFRFQLQGNEFVLIDVSTTPALTNNADITATAQCLFEVAQKASTS